MGPRLLAGRYQLDRILGSGGTGTVWLGFDLELTRQVAIKELRIPDTSDQAEARELVERVMIEAQSAARIDHPNVVKVYDVLSEDGKPWLVMQLVHGQTLGQLLRAGPLTIGQAATVGLAVVDALQAAHALGIVHRDVTPGNVLVSGDRRILLTDFSIAKVLDRPGITKTSDLWGTPGYIAPELVRNWPPSEWSDLFGLGVLLFRMVEGIGPFDRPTSEATMIASVTEPHGPAVHAGPLAPVIHGLLDKDPMARWTARQTWRALQDIAHPRPGPGGFRPVTPVLADSPSSSGPVSSPRPPELVSDRHPSPVLPPGSAESPSGPVPSPKPRQPRRRRVVIGGSAAATVTVALTATLALTLTGTHSDSSSGTPTPAPALSTSAATTRSQNSADSPSASTSATGSPSSSVIIATPTVDVTPKAVENGGTVTITGGGFTPGETVYITLNWEAFAAGNGLVSSIDQVTANRDGGFGPITRSVQAGEMGPSSMYWIEAKGATSGHLEGAALTIE